MKVIPILALTNTAALVMALLLFLEVEDLKTQVGTSRSDSRGPSEISVSYDDFEALKGRVSRHDEQFATNGSEGRGAPLAKSADNVSSAVEEGAAIDRSFASGEFDEEAAAKDPAMEGFRNRVRVAQKLNQREDRVSREIDRIDKLISDSKIGALNPKQKAQVAEQLIQYREARGIAFRGLWQSPEVQNAPDDQRRTVLRETMATLSETLKADAQAELEKVMPAADAKEVMDASRGGDRGGMTRRRGSR